MLLLYRFVERRYCLIHERCASFNLKENALEPWIVFILVITLSLESHVNPSVNCHQLTKHVGKLTVMNFEILKSEKLVLNFLLAQILKLH